MHSSTQMILSAKIIGKRLMWQSIKKWAPKYSRKIVCIVRMIRLLNETN